MTGNMQKITEVCFKCTHNTELSAKEKGDAVIMGLEVASYLLGAVSASFLQHYASDSTPGGVNGPMLVVLPIIPLKLFASRTIQLCAIKLPNLISQCDHRLPFISQEHHDGQPAPIMNLADEVEV